MPYELREENSQYCIYKQGASEALSCFDNKAKAEAYLQALYANIEDAKMKQKKTPQSSETLESVLARAGYHIIDNELVSKGKATIHTRAYGSAIKALDKGRIGGYLVRFTNSNDRDLYDTWFDADTDFWMEKGYPIRNERILLEHGLESFAKVMPIGLIDMVQEDEYGIYIEGKLHDRSDYEQYIQSLSDKKGLGLSPSQVQEKAMLAETAIRAIVETGKIGWSSGALPQGVVVSDEGHIESWPIIEGSATFTPAEVDGTEIEPIRSALKQLEEYLFTSKSLSSISPAKDATGHIERNGMDSDTQSISWSFGDAITDPVTITISNQKSNQGTKQMNVEEMLAQILSMLEQMASSAGMGEAEATEMATDVTEELKADVPEEEMAKAVDEEEAAALAEKAFELFKKKHAAWQKVQGAAKNALAAKFDTLKKNALPTEQQFSASKSGKPKGNQISVGELEKYAALSGSDMALGVKLAVSMADQWNKRGLTIGNLAEKGIFSEDYLRVMAHKLVDEMRDWKPKDSLGKQDYAAVRAAYPFRADDINATDITGFGLEWVELQYDSTLWERARDRTDLFNLLSQKGMEVKTVPNGVKGLNIKLNTSSGSVYTMPESNDLDATGRPEVVAGITQFGTSEVEENLATHVLAHAITMQLEEDSIINVLSWLPTEMQTTLAESLENSIINGDKTVTVNSNINIIDGTPGTGTTTPDYIAWDGLRHEFIIDHTAFARSGGGALALTDYEETKNLFPSSIKNRKQNMLYVIDEKTESATRRFPELLTFGVAGQQATVYSGELPPLFGVDVYMSGFLELSDTVGKVSVTASNNKYGTLICVYAPYWVYGRRRDVTIEQDRNSLQQTTTFVAIARHLFKSRGAGASAGTYKAGTYA